MDQPKIHFIVSAPRSGSTWLSTALNHHPEVFATEHRFFGEFCEVWRNNNGTSSPRITFDKYAQAFGVHYFHDAMGLDRAEFLDALQKSFVNFIVGFGSRRTKKPIVIDKVTPYAGTSELTVGKIRSLFPESKIIQLVRDGRDVLTSGTYDWILKDGMYTPRYQFVIEKSRQTLNRFFDDEVIAKIAQHWKETLLPFDDQPADLRISYEGMKDDLASTLGLILRALNASKDDAALEQAVEETRFEKMTGRDAGDADSPTAKARTGVAGDWKRHFTARDGRLFHDIAGDQLLKYGYETDPAWFEALPESLDWDTEKKS